MGMPSLSPLSSLGATIVRELKRTVEKNISRSVNQAFMSVPAEVNMTQRNATVRAASLAGNNVARVCVSARMSLSSPFVLNQKSHLIDMHACNHCSASSQAQTYSQGSPV